MPADESLRELERRLGHSFDDVHLLEEAVTHCSYANDAGINFDYERLEFLGDAVLGLMTSEWLFQHYRSQDEGDLTKLKAWLVSAPSLAEAGRRLNLGAALRLSVGEERSGGRDRDATLADAMEAVIAALYLDGGMHAVRPHVDELLERGVRRYAREEAVRDAKTRLQEIVQARGWELPEYRDRAVRGPDHDRTYTVECWIHGRRVSLGSGSSRKLAQQAAALEALRDPELAASGD